MITEEELEAGIAEVENETKEAGNTRLRIANLFRMLKGWAQGLMLFSDYTTSATLNGLPAGSDLSGLSLMEAFKKATSRPFQVATVSINSLPSPVEQGTTQTFTVAGNVSLNDDTGVVSGKILKNGVEWHTFTGTSYSKEDSITADTTYTVEVVTEKSGTITASRSVDFDLYHWYGPAAARPDAATARDLAKVFKTQGNTFILNTGNTHKSFYIILAPGEKLSEVKDLETNATIRFTLVDPAFSVNDGNPDPEEVQEIGGYKLYELVNSVPFSSNHRLNITVVNE